MFTHVRPSALALGDSEYMPPLLRPLMTAVKKGEALEETVQAIVHNLGFDSFMYAASASGTPNHESKIYIFTTLPTEWVSRYDQRAYVEVDPRVLHCLQSRVPFVWDHFSERGRDAHTDAFLDDALAHGIGSGVAFTVRELRGGALIAYNSANPRVDEVRRYAIAGMLGDLVLLGTYFHEIFMKGVVEQGVAPRSQGAPLSERERECLTLASHGLTSHDIARKLTLSERTIQFHFDGIRSKLGAANRQEAIAKAVAAGIIRA